MADEDTHIADPTLDAGADPADGHADQAPDRASTARTPHRRPRWVKVAVIVVLALVALFVILQLTGVAPDGGHGPGLHG
jgi:hypothetical protein